MDESACGARSPAFLGREECCALKEKKVFTTSEAIFRPNTDICVAIYLVTLSEFLFLPAEFRGFGHNSLVLKHA